MIAFHRYALRIVVAAFVAAAAAAGSGRFAPVNASAQVGGSGFAARIAAGGTHSLAVRPDGIVWAWGDNHLGQLGLGTTTSQSAPVQVPSLGAGHISVSAGLAHSLAVRSDGTAWAWGLNSNGQLGDGTTMNRLVPVQVANLTNVIEVASGAGHSVALRADGTIWTWGRNVEGQLGDGTSTRRTLPVLVTGLANVEAIAAGGFHSLALLTDGTVRAWGLNLAGQLGDGTQTIRRRPTQVQTLAGIRAIAAGASHSLAVGGDGSVYAWGLNLLGQLEGCDADLRSNRRDVYLAAVCTHRHDNAKCHCQVYDRRLRPDSRIE